MDTTLIGQLACRGALELPNDPFAAMADTRLTMPGKLTAAQRKRAFAQAAAYYDWLMREYGQ